jgi:protein MpaA
MIATMNTSRQLLPEQIHVERAYRRRQTMSQSVYIVKRVCRREKETQTWKFAIFGGMHGDEEAGILAANELAEWAAAQPEELRDFELHVYPVCNPSGRMAGTRHCMSGHDLNREFWVGSALPEVAFLEGELRRENYDGIISLHTDDESVGIYGYVSGALLSQQVLEPALEAAGRIIPRNPSPYIDGFAAERGIIKEGYFGVLSSPPEQRPRAMEIVFETPDYVRMELQVEASVVAVKTILAEYRSLQSFAANL